MKQPGQVPDDAALDLNVHIAPATAAVFGGGVVLADVQTTGERDAIVHHQDLAMIAPGEREPLPPGSERVVLGDVDARVAQVV